MKLSLHPDAATNFNKIAESLLSKLIIINIKSISKNKHSFDPDYFISSTISEEDLIGDIIGSSIDPIGSVNGRFFDHNGDRIGLYADCYQDLMRLSENMQRIKQIYIFFLSAVPVVIKSPFVSAKIVLLLY